MENRRRKEAVEVEDTQEEKAPWSKFVKEENTRYVQKWIASGLIVVISFIWGIYAHTWLKRLSDNESLFSSFRYTIAIAVCTALLILGICIRQTNKLRKLYPILLCLPAVLLALASLSAPIEWGKLLPGLWALIALMVVSAPFFCTSPQPPHKPHKDYLGRGLLYKNFYKWIRSIMTMESEQGMAIAVRGAWGCGKSHFINHLTYTLKHDYSDQIISEDIIYKGKYAIASIDVWKCSSTDAFRRDIAEALSSLISENNWYLNNRITRLASRIIGMFWPSSATAFEEILNFITIGAESSHTQFSKIAWKMHKMRKPCILVLDNLERSSISLENVLLPTIERLKELPTLMTICGIRYENRSNQQLEDEQGRIMEYSERESAGILKVFDHVIPIPLINEDYLDNFIGQYIMSRWNDKCPMLNNWLRKERALCFRTPREVAAVIDSLALIEFLYLSHHKNYNFDNLLVGRRRGRIFEKNRAVFAVAAINILYPPVGVMLENCTDPRKELKTFLAKSETLAQGREIQDERNIKSMEEISEEDQSVKGHEEIDWTPYVGSRQLVELVAQLSKTGDDDLSFALRRKYLHLGALSDGESTNVIKFWQGSHLSPQQAIREYFGNIVTSVEEPAVYDSVMDYAFRFNMFGKNIEYIIECLEMEIVPANDGFICNYKNKHTFAYKLINMWYSISRRRRFTDSLERFKNAIEQYLSQSTINVLDKCIGLCERLENVQTREDVRRATDLGNDAPTICYDLSRGFSQRADLEKYQRACDFVSGATSKLCSIYLRQICNIILSSDFYSLDLDLFSRCAEVFAKHSDGLQENMNAVKATIQPKHYDALKECLDGFLSFECPVTRVVNEEFLVSVDCFLGIWLSLWEVAKTQRDVPSPRGSTYQANPLLCVEAFVEVINKSDIAMTETARVVVEKLNRIDKDLLS